MIKLKEKTARKKLKKKNNQDQFSMLNFPTWKKYFVIIVCLLGVYVVIPNFVSQKYLDKYSFLPKHTLKLGLDLQGGSQLLMQVGFDSFLKEQLGMINDDIRRDFRKAKIGYSNLRVISDERSVYAIKFSAIDKSKIDAIKEIIAKISTDFEVDVEDGNEVIITYTKDYLKILKRDVLAKSVEIVRRRVDETGTREPIIQMQGDNRILLEVPGLENPESLKRLLGKTAKMTFHLMDENNPFAINLNHAKPGYLLLEDADKKSQNKYLVAKAVQISGENLVDSQPTYNNGQPVVSFKFNNQGGKKFAQVTADNVGKPFAVVLDGKVITAPRINEPILGGSGIISGNFNVTEANELALLLRSGALPAPLQVIEERSVGPSLGSDSIVAGTEACILAVILVFGFILFIYKRFGLYADIALAIHLILTLAVLTLFGATLTLPGIAGLVLGLGMSVDANVLIYERIKEEIKIGKTPFAAIDNGFKLAFATIIDTNITTLISTLFMYIYGSGPIKGFAVTLAIGLICSMFTAVTLTKMQVFIWAKKAKPKVLKI